MADKLKLNIVYVPANPTPDSNGYGQVQPTAAEKAKFEQIAEKTIHAIAAARNEEPQKTADLIPFRGDIWTKIDANGQRLEGAEVQYHIWVSKKGTPENHGPWVKSLSSLSTPLMEPVTPGHPRIISDTLRNGGFGLDVYMEGKNLDDLNAAADKFLPAIKEKMAKEKAKTSSAITLDSKAIYSYLDSQGFKGEAKLAATELAASETQINKVKQLG